MANLITHRKVTMHRDRRFPMVFAAWEATLLNKLLTTNNMLVSSYKLNSSD